MIPQAVLELKCAVVERKAQPSLSIRYRTPLDGLHALFGKAYSSIGQHFGKARTFPVGPPFAIYHNMDMQDLDVEIGFPVGRRVTGQGEIKASELPGGRFASCVYHGSYDGIGRAYDVLSDWAREQGHDASGIAIEFYLNDPAKVPPEKLQTQILLQLK